MQPKVSVIVPVYNVEKYLRQCLDSIVNQTLDEIEIICVNDGSKDHSDEILNEYAEKDHRITVLTQENSGLSSARNLGMANATGKYISFIDSDDYIELDMLEKLYNKAEETSADITICDLWLYFHDTKKKAYFRDQTLYLYLKNKIFTLSEYPQLITCIAAWDRIYLRSFLEDIKAQFPVGFLYEDQPFTVYTMLHARRIAIVPDQLYYYRKNAGGSITDNESKLAKSRVDFLKTMAMALDAMPAAGAPDAIREAYIPYIIGNAFTHQKNAKKYAEFRKFYQGLRQLLTEKDYEIIAEQAPAFAKYGKLLESGKCVKAYFSIKRSTYLYRGHDGHIYFKFTANGKAHKIR